MTHSMHRAEAAGNGDGASIIAFRNHAPEGSPALAYPRTGTREERMALPEFPVEGGCQCGAVRYRLKASPLTVYNCHCKDCQRFSGGACSISMIVRNEDFEALPGQTVR